MYQVGDTFTWKKSSYKEFFPVYMIKEIDNERECMYVEVVVACTRNPRERYVGYKTKMSLNSLQDAEFIDFYRIKNYPRNKFRWLKCN